MKNNIEFEKSVNNTQKKAYNSLDVAKFICALLIITIHILPFGSKYTLETGTWQGYANYFIKQYVARIAVPFFFVCSGFFLYRKTSLSDFSLEPTKKYAFRILKLYLVWTIIYLPIKILNFSENSLLLKDNILDYIGDFIFAGSYYHLWYLPATVAACLIISFLLKKNVKVRNILIIALILYGIGLLEQSYFGIIRPLKESTPFVFDVLEEILEIIRSTRDGIFDGFIFMAMGMYFAFYGVKVPKKKALFGFIASLIFLFAEVFLLTAFDMIRENDMYLFLIPAAFFMFSYLSQAELKDSSTYKMIRTMSSLIFYGHPFILYFLKRVFKANSLEYGRNSYLFILTVAISILLSRLIIWLSERKYFGWLKVIY